MSKILSSNWITEMHMKKTRTMLVMVIVTVVLLLALELSARLYINWQRGNASVGLSERTQNLNYQPFTMWGKNLDRDSDKFLENLPPGTFRILLLGASTAAAFNEDLLKNTFKKNLNKNVVLFNAASGGFNVRQEAISLLLVAEKIKPNLILVLDGANDVIHSTRPGIRTGTTYLDSTYRTISQRPFLAPLIYILQNSQLYNGLLSKSRRSGFQNSYKSERTREAISVYLKTRDFINHYAIGINTPIVFALQPFVGFSVSNDDAAAKAVYSYRESFVVSGFNSIVSRSTSSMCFIDTNIEIRNRKLNLSFSDDVHFKNSTGYQYLAAKFLEQYKSCYSK